MKEIKYNCFSIIEGNSNIMISAPHTYTHKRKGKNITVCEEWLDFANFNEWFNENYYTVGNETMDLCRNLLNQDNDEFSPDECVFVPRRIMQLITPKNLSKSGLPRGVGYRECSDTYYASGETLLLQMQ